MSTVRLKERIELKGSCKGTTATLIERTASKALYQRDDGYWETFLVKINPAMVYVKGEWTATGETKEVYPNDNAFGVFAWCGKEEKIRNFYESLSESRNADYANDVSRFFRRSPESKAIAPLKENNVKNQEQFINSFL